MKDEIEIESMKTFETHDLYLSSALKINGFRLINLRRDERGRGIFVFEDYSQGDWFLEVRQGGYKRSVPRTTDIGREIGRLKDETSQFEDLRQKP